MAKIGNIDLGDKPIILAPMEDVTDRAFRLLCKENGADLMFTEFISSEGLIRNIDKSKVKISFTEFERPIGIQLFGNNVESMKLAAEKAALYNPDIIDINFGCPVKKIVNKGCGSGILKNIPLMIKITEAIVKSTNLPVTVKTRLGWDESDKPIVEIAERLQDVGIKAITIHGRTRAQLYTGKADWTLIGKVKSNSRMNIPVIGNGDIKNPENAREMFDKYGIDGIMIGRASIGNPWIFKEIKHFLNTGDILQIPTIKEKVNTCIRYLEKAIEFKGEGYAVLETRKHYSQYFKGIASFKPYRLRLMKLQTFDEVKILLNEIIEKFHNES